MAFFLYEKRKFSKVCAELCICAICTSSHAALIYNLKLMKGIRLKKTEEYELRNKIMFKKRVEFAKIQGKMDGKRRKWRNVPNSQKNENTFVK